MKRAVVRRGVAAGDGVGVCWAVIDSPGRAVIVRTRNDPSAPQPLLGNMHGGGMFGYPRIAVPIEDGLQDAQRRGSGGDGAHDSEAAEDALPSRSPVLGVLGVDGFERTPIGRPHDEARPETGVLRFLRAVGCAIGTTLGMHRRAVALARIGEVARAVAARTFALPHSGGGDGGGEAYVIENGSPLLAALGGFGAREVIVAALDALRAGSPFLLTAEVWLMGAVDHELHCVARMLLGRAADAAEAEAVGAQAVGAGAAVDAVTKAAKARAQAAASTGSMDRQMAAAAAQEAVERRRRRVCVDFTRSALALEMLPAGAAVSGLLRGAKQADAVGGALAPDAGGAAGEPFVLLDQHSTLVAPFDGDGAIALSRQRKRAAAKARGERLGAIGAGADAISSSSEEEDSCEEAEGKAGDGSSGVQRVSVDPLNETLHGEAYWALAMTRAQERGGSVSQRRREPIDDMRCVPFSLAPSRHRPCLLCLFSIAALTPSPLCALLWPDMRRKWHMPSRPACASCAPRSAARAKPHARVRRWRVTRRRAQTRQRWPPSSRHAEPSKTPASRS